MTISGSDADDQAMSVEVTVEKIGGIEHRSIDIEPGVTVLAGRNATNRTSLLSAIGTVLGGSTASLKSDAEEGYVRMEIGESTYAVDFTRTGSGVRREGDPYSDRGEFVDLFVSLLEDNEARRAVERRDDLREVIMRPVDTDAIEAEIRQFRSDLEEVTEEIDRVEKLRAELPSLEDRRRSLEDEISTINEDLADLRDDAADVESALDADDEPSEMMERLEELRTDRNEVVNELEVKRAERDALIEDEAAIESELSSLSDVSAEDISEIEDDLDVARKRKQRLDESIASLSTIVEFNEELLTGGRELPGIQPDTERITAELAPDSDRLIDCWTCGSQVNRSEIADRIDDLRSLVDKKRDERGDLGNEIRELEESLSKFQEAANRHESLSDQLGRAREKIADRKETIEGLEDEASKLDEQIAELEAEIADREKPQEGKLAEAYKRISDLEFERGQLERELENVEGKVDDIESLPALEDLQDQRNELRSKLEATRGRIDDIESSAVNEFNEHMDELLSLLSYENLSRVWIERKHRESNTGASFDLHVVRESSDNAGYEDTLDHLSESEREVVGLVVALAGYLVHDVHETVPFMLLDSLEAIDAERIAALVEYLSEFAHYTVVALLPEDAEALERGGEVALKGFA